MGCLGLPFDLIFILRTGYIDLIWVILIYITILFTYFNLSRDFIRKRAWVLYIPIIILIIVAFIATSLPQKS